MSIIISIPALSSYTVKNYINYNIGTYYILLTYLQSLNISTYLHAQNKSLPWTTPKINSWNYTSIPENSPTPYYTTVWLQKYGQGHFNSSIFAKGHLLALKSNSIEMVTQSSTCYLLKSYKTTVKQC